MPRCLAGCSLSVILAILIVASGQIRKNCPAHSASAQLTTALPGGDRDPCRCSPLDTDCNLPRLNRHIRRHLSLLTTMVRQVPHVNPYAGPAQDFSQVRPLQDHRPDRPGTRATAQAVRGLAPPATATPGPNPSHSTGCRGGGNGGLAPQAEGPPPSNNTVTGDRRSHQGRKAGTVILVRKLAKRRGLCEGSTAVLCVSQVCQRRGIVGPHGS